ncbi:MAG: hypothetical protein NY202_02465 [Mollicutes bacterium UO1]
MLDASKISIDDTDYSGDNRVVVIDRSSEKKDLLDLEKLLNKILPGKYGQPILEYGPDVDLVDPTSDIGQKPNPSAGVKATGL